MDPRLNFGEGVPRRPRADAERITAICQDPAIQRFTRVPIPYTLTLKPRQVLGSKPSGGSRAKVRGELVRAACRP